MKRADGTMSGVTQSIDTWSFGCVLSVAATWVVLGFQGVRQFEQLRQLSPANKKDGITYDRFHDGMQVLPEVRKWHNYLRGHVRPSDTATLLVLDLVENSMLQTETSNRVELEELCDKLQEILGWATDRVENLKIHSRKTDPVVLQALYNIEAKAHQEKSSRRKTVPLNHPVASVTGAEILNPPQRARATMQVHKERIIQNKPLGQTPYRKEILEKELKANILFEEEDSEKLIGAHNGGFTDSPTNAHPEVDAFGVARRAKRRNPEHLPAAISGYTPGAQPPSPPFTPYHQRARQQPYIPQDIPDGMSSRSEEHRRAQYASSVAGASMENSQLGAAIKTTQMDPNDYATVPSPTTASNPPSLASRTHNAYVEGIRPHFPSPPGPTSIARSELDPMSPNSIFGIGQPGFSPRNDHDQQHRWQANGAPQLEDPSPSHSHFQENRMYAPKYVGVDIDEVHAQPNPLITVSQPVELASTITPPRRRDTRDHTTEKQAVITEEHFESTPAETHEPLPPSVLELPYDVCAVRASVDNDDPKGKRARIKGMLGFEERKADKSLTRTFGDGREIVCLHLEKSSIISLTRTRSSLSTMAQQCLITGLF